MAVSVVSGWESGLDPAEIPFVLVNAWICFRTWSSSSLGNKPLSPLEESSTRHANRQMDFSPWFWWDTTYMLQIVLINHGLQPMNTFSPSPIFCYQCLAVLWRPRQLELEAQWGHFFLECFIKIVTLIYPKKIASILLHIENYSPCFTAAYYKLLASIGLNFHIPVDFRPNFLFPHIVSIRHPNLKQVEKSWPSLVIY